MSKLNQLEPHLVWNIFEAITQVPRRSKHEEKIIAYLIDFAQSHNLEYRKDNIGNIIIRRNGSQGREHYPTVILQSHVDMVCEKNSDVCFDFDTDPIKVRLAPEGWVSAEGTTLGADCGIGMAAALAILIDKEIETPPIEALFTVDEETGLTGALQLGGDMLTGNYLINLDSEDEGEIFIGCAGGIGTVATFDYKSVATPKNYTFFRIDINGLKGGHSGDDIEKGRGNSNQLLARLLIKLLPLEPVISYIDGGNLHNAIPREAYAILGVATGHITTLFSIFESFTSDIKVEFSISEPTLSTSISEMPFVDHVIDSITCENLIKALVGAPNGVLAMSQTMHGLVEISTNLASVKIVDGNKIVVTTSQRSSVESAKFFAATAIKSVFSLAGAQVKQSSGYPGWRPNPKSKLLELATRSYVRLFDKEPKIRAIHAGLECGLFLEKYPHIEMISFGPTLRGVHSPDERLEISTVDKFWRLLVEVLKEIMYSPK